MKAKDLGLVLSVDQCVKMASGTLEMQMDKVKRLRSQQSKRAAKNSLEFFEAVVHHLKRLKELERRSESNIGEAFCATMQAGPTGCDRNKPGGCKYRCQAFEKFIQKLNEI
ncbi:hypothetical protein AAAX65_07445 [Alistipes finegoldii]|jgi:hypothetical protein|uniref:hypothetical protein n=1 Tax=Alistipes finegoldii TaxID=214856 RepID=UPI0020548E51|nr:MAG TPA: hypothetical protein [Caudoviricetes sp.]